MASVIELVDRMLEPDARGRMTGGRPHFYVLRTKDGVLCRRHAELDDAVGEALERIALAERGRQRDWPLDYGACLSLLASVGPLKAVRAGMLYRLEDPPESDAVRITASNAGLLRAGLDEWLPDVEAGLPMYAAVVDGKAASICASVRQAPGAHAAGVETLPAWRGRGLAARAVAGWARAVLRMDAAPFYGASFDNLASQDVARRLGMRRVGSEFDVTLGDAPAA